MSIDRCRAPAHTPSRPRRQQNPSQPPNTPQKRRPKPAKLPPIMEESLLNAVHWMLALVALPVVGLPAIFVVSVISATLLPLGSEPAVLRFVKLAPELGTAHV